MHYRHYLYGTEFMVRSDHKPFVYLYRLKETNAKLTRLRLELAEYNFSIEHIKDKDNVVADALSRISIDDIRTKEEHEEDLEEAGVLAVTRAHGRKMAERERDLQNPPETKLEVITVPNMMEALNDKDIKGIQRFIRVG